MSGVNTFTIGDGTSGNKDFCDDSTTDRCIRWNETAGLWTVQQAGTTYSEIATYTSTNGLAQNQVVLGNGTGALLTVVSGTSGQLLTNQGASAPIWTTVSSDVGGTNARRVWRTSGNVTTTSTSLTDFTGATVTITTAANPVVVGWTASCYVDDVNARLQFAVDVDGVADSMGEILQHSTASEAMDCSFIHMTTVLTAASHTIKLRWLTSAGTSTTFCNSAANGSCGFSVFEVVD